MNLVHTRVPEGLTVPKKMRTSARSRRIFLASSELAQKLTQLAPAKARELERLVREAMALADANDAPPGRN